MSFTSASTAEVIALMDKRLAAAKAELATLDRKVNQSYVLMAGRMDMVVVEAEGGIFRLDAASPDKGYSFPTFSRAKAAANKWNGALDAAQRAARCAVTVVGRAQYLEHIITNLEELRPNMVRMMEVLKAQEEAKKAE